MESNLQNQPPRLRFSINWIWMIAVIGFFVMGINGCTFGSGTTSLSEAIPTTEIAPSAGESVQPIITPSLGSSTATVSSTPTKLPPTATPDALPTHPSLSVTERSSTPETSPEKTPTSMPTLVPTDTPTATSTPGSLLPSPEALPTDSILLPAPRLIFPPDGWNERVSVVTLEWDLIPNAVAYQVDTRNGQPGQAQWKVWGPLGPQVTKLQIKYDDYPEYFKIPGTVYYWRVVAINENEQPGEYSKWRQFIFQRPYP